MAETTVTAFWDSQWISSRSVTGVLFDTRSLVTFQVKISVDGTPVLEAPMCELRDVWEETSFMLERRQANPHCVQEEQDTLKLRQCPPYKLPFDPNTPLFSRIVGKLPNPSSRHVIQISLPLALV